jgi:hypothetical protein
MKVINQEVCDNWAMYNGDAIPITSEMPENSLHYTIFSPPFASLFTYSDSELDMGNCREDGEFTEHFSFLVGELYRATMPGRLLSFHCMDLLATITHDGFIGLKDFPGQMIRVFQNAGFIYHSKVVIWKDPLVQAVRTKNLGLAHKQISTDSSRCNMGLPDYVVTMRKPGTNPEPIAHGRGFEYYIGDMPEPTSPKNKNPRVNKYSHKVWQRYASPVWFDINQTNTLNVSQARDRDDEKHICPLQLDTIARCLELWSNPGDVVFSPFAGIGSEGYQALKMGRKFVGVELKTSYYNVAVRNLKKATAYRHNQLDMFGGVDNGRMDQIGN